MAEPPLPRYAYFWLATAAIMALGAVVCLVYALAEDMHFQGLAVTLAVVAAVTVAGTIISLRADRGYERLADRVVEGVAYHVAIEVKEARGLAADLHERAAKEADARVGQLTGDIEQQVRQVQLRIESLTAQQETLAELATGGGYITLDLANGDVYELGKRVGRDETLRELGKDQTA